MANCPGDGAPSPSSELPGPHRAVGPILAHGLGREITKAERESESHFYPACPSLLSWLQRFVAIRHFPFISGAHHPQSDSFPVGGGQDPRQVVLLTPINPHPSTHIWFTTGDLCLQLMIITFLGILPYLLCSVNRPIMTTIYRTIYYPP